MSYSVYFGGRKGGSTKTTTAHLMCLGAILMKQPAAYVLTDPSRKVKDAGRPYNVFDGRNPSDLAKILASMGTDGNGWWIFDGGGNRPAFDAELARNVDLVIIPFKNSGDDLDAAMDDLLEYPNALAWPCAWPTNEKARHTAQQYIDKLSAKFPMRIIAPPLYFVNSVHDLTGAELDNPSTPTRSAARRAFEIMSDTFAAHVEQAPQETAEVRAIA